MADPDSESPTPTSEEVPTQIPSQRHIRQKTDPTWGHCTQRILDNKPVLVCLYCPKIVKGGGINRIKSHLAWETGNVEKCPNVPPDVKYQMLKHNEESRKKRKFLDCVDSNRLHEGSSADEVSNVNQLRPPAPPSTKKGKNPTLMDEYFMPRTTPGVQPTIVSVMQSKEVLEKCDIAIAKWM